MLFLIFVKHRVSELGKTTLNLAVFLFVSFLFLFLSGRLKSKLPKASWYDNLILALRFRQVMIRWSSNFADCHTQTRTRTECYFSL